MSAEKVEALADQMVRDIVVPYEGGDVDQAVPYAALLVRAQEVVRDLEPKVHCVGPNCGGYYGDKPEECECGAVPSRKAARALAADLDSALKGVE